MKNHSRTQELLKLAAPIRATLKVALALCLPILLANCGSLTTKTTVEPERLNERTTDGAEVSRSLTGLHINDVTFDADGGAHVNSTADYLVTYKQLATWDNRVVTENHFGPQLVLCTFTDPILIPMVAIFGSLTFHFQWVSEGFSEWGHDCFGKTKATSQLVAESDWDSSDVVTRNITEPYQGHLTIQFDDGPKQTIGSGQLIAAGSTVWNSLFIEILSGDISDHKAVAAAQYQTAVIAAQQKKQAEIAAAQDEIAREQETANEAAAQAEDSSQDTSSQDGEAGLALLGAFTTAVTGAAQMKIANQQARAAQTQERQAAALARQQQLAQQNVALQQRRQELNAQQQAVQRQQQVAIQLAQQVALQLQPKAQQSASISFPGDCMVKNYPYQGTSSNVWNGAYAYKNSCNRPLGITYCLTGVSAENPFNCEAQRFGSGQVDEGASNALSLGFNSGHFELYAVQCEQRSEVTGPQVLFPKNVHFANNKIYGDCP